MNLQPRERRMIAIGAAVLAAAASFEWIIDPLLQSRATLAKTLPALRAQAALLESNRHDLASAVAARQAQRQALSESALREALAQAQLEAQSVQLDGAGAQLRFTRTDPGAVLRWAANIEPVFALGVKKLEVRWGSAEHADLGLWLAP